ncbi:alpha/beta fold hydrolase [Methanohalophilus portucalensis]|uniref:Alpha/beta hydrolase n=2 Tax=Methanohalophilus portucalensis TaxID=39664 RepID=A0A1L9C6M9_9EURY|nr:alpha/beta hydrolase [Methanohalophilus portucalensis]ATU08742.1 alpha/beta hydrolase [Methanohalophilus portucalensis]OJH50134.1 alpha/beta hydrolase [Methanohalophilus portucalensis FDF-1]RNI13082.1 alpha/beta hydrolase [Methanohalophilus portucalensis FDF-1]SMH31209.1 Pimeloyl-ACP methyl ester carboxylesterase [Methanohalophilus portucalensis FDF-1]
MAEEKTFSAEIYKDNKHEDWLILIHGFGGSAKTWNKQIGTFSRHYNLLVLEMHKNTSQELLNLDMICEHIHNTMLFYGVKKAHFISFSFSSLISLRFAVLYPNVVNSLIMGGGVIRYSLKTKLLIFLAMNLKKKVNYMLLYRFFAYIIMPKKNHRRSRDIFVNEARKLGHDEFCKWLNIIPQTMNGLEWLKSLQNDISILFISGSKDYLFLNDILKYSKKFSNSYVEIITDCGHVCSIEQYEKFNNIVINHLSRV